MQLNGLKGVHNQTLSKLTDTVQTLLEEVVQSRALDNISSEVIAHLMIGAIAEFGRQTEYIQLKHFLDIQRQPDDNR